MFEIAIAVVGFVAGWLCAAYYVASRLKGDKTVAQTLRSVVPFLGGGPGGRDR